jgi:hypothetical protein
MDEALEAVELVAEFGLDGIVAWLFRLVGVALALAGVGFWLLGDGGFLWLPAVLVAAGVVVAAAPSLVLAAVELFG